MANISFNIWPPSQCTHDAVVNCPIETLFEPSILSKHYISMSHDKADTTAHRIKDKAFVATSASTSANETTSRSSKSTPTRSTDACSTSSSPELPPDLHATVPQRLPLSTLLLPPMRKSHSLKLSRVLIQLHICLCWGFDAIFLY
ncbi:hypothetical protein ACSBR1_011985 [Camellia fascicularis]